MNLDKILRYSILAGVFAIPFIPLIVSPSLFFPFITGKNFAFRILVEMVFAVWVLLALRDPRYRPTGSWLLYGVIAFVAIIGIADLFGENPFKSLWSNFERMEGFIGIVHLLLYMIVAGTVLSSLALWRKFWNTSIAVSVVVGFVAIAQLAGWYEIHQGGVRLDATLGNATYLALYMLFHAFVTAYLFLSSPKKTWLIRGMYGAIFILQVVILYYTATRGAILGFVGGMLLACLLIALFEREKKQLRKFAAGGILTLLVLVGVFFGIKDTAFVKDDPVLSRFSSLTAEGGIVSRLPIWNMAWHGFSERPILGWGQENFNYVFNKYYNPDLYAQEPWFDRVHNIFLDWLIAGGILGLLGYLSIFVFLLLVLWSQKQNFTIAERSVLTGLLAAYGFHNLFVFDQLISYILFFSFVAYMYARTRMGNEAVPFKDKRVGNTFALAGAGVAILVVLVSSLYFFNIRGVTVAHALVQGIQGHPEGISKNIENYTTALSYNTVGRQEVREQTISFVNQVLSAQGADEETKKVALALGERAAKEGIAQAPDDVRAHLFASMLYQLAGQPEMQEQEIRKALELSPKKQLLFFELGSNLVNRNRIPEALETFKKAYELEPKYTRARTLYGIVAAISGDQKLASELLDGVPASAIATDDSVLAFYIQGKRYDRVLEIWLEREKRNPNDAQTILSVAAAYYAAGKKDEAIKEVELMIEKNPQFKAQGDQIIGDIRAGKPLQ